MPKIKCGCVVFGSIMMCPTHAAAPDMLKTLQAFDAYFMALHKLWHAGDGRLTTDDTQLVKGGAEVNQLCEDATMLMMKVFEDYKLERGAKNA